MTDEQALLAAICSRPADDTPRLIYADWLDDQAGEPTVRAEIIRQGCEFAADAGRVTELPLIPTERGFIRRSEIRSSYIEPSAALAATWLPSGVHSGWCLWERGFVEFLVCPAADFFAHIDSLYWHPSQPRDCPVTAHPITHVKLLTWPTPDDLARHPWRLWKPQTGDLLPAILMLEFPGIDFDWPDQPPADRGVRVVPDTYGRIRRAVLTSVLALALTFPPSAVD